MNTIEFDKIVNYRIAKIQEILQEKAKEYASEDDDRLHNFNIAGRINNTTREKALWGMATKHFVSVMDMIDKEEIPSKYMIEEKIGDAINYLILLEICFKERLSKL